MAPNLTDYTYQFGDGGFLLNGDDIAVPFFDITDVSGLDTAPIRINTDDRQGVDGTYVDAEFTSMRTIVISGNLYTDPNDVSVVKLLRGQFGPGSIQPFYIKEPGSPIQFVNAQGGGAQYDADNSRGFGMTQMQLTLLAADPYVYDYPANVDSAVFDLTSPVGMGFNFGFNLGFGGTLLESAATVMNGGTHTAYPVIQLVGPLTNPVITDSVGNIVMPLALTLSASDVLVIDCRNKSVILNGQASRRNSLQGRDWFSVPADTSDSFFLSADAGSGQITVTLYNTYE